MRHTIFYIARNIVVAEEEDLGGKIGGGGFKFSGSAVEANSAFFDQFERVLTEAPGFLYGNTYYFVHFLAVGFGLMALNSLFVGFN